MFAGTFLKITQKTEVSGIWYYYQLNLVAKHVDQSDGNQQE